MGSVVEFHCDVCAFSSGKLHLGWGKTGRAQSWFGLARCEPCQELGVADLNLRRTTGGDPRCGGCNGLLILLEGTSVSVPCPSCRRPLQFASVGTWN